MPRTRSLAWAELKIGLVSVFAIVMATLMGPAPDVDRVSPWIVGMLGLSMFAFAGALAVLFAMTSASVKFSETAEAYGWIGTGQLIGAAAGSAIAGFLIDGVGPQGAYWAAAVFAIVGTGVAVACVRWFPDLRLRDASPIPDTEPVPLQPS